MPVKHEVIEFQSGPELPELDLVFTGCRVGPNGYAFDIVDFSHHRIDRWQLPFIRNRKWPAEIRNTIYNEGLPLGYEDADLYCDEHYMTPHTAQLAPQGKLFATFGVAENGFDIIVVDTRSAESRLVSDESDTPRLFTSTGDFDAAYRHFYFASWPTTNTSRNAVKTVPNRFEIRSLDIDTLEERLHYSFSEEIAGSQVVGVGLPKRLHQITMSSDGRYVVCSPFDCDEHTPSPDEPGEGGPAGSGPGGKGAIRLESLVIVDLQESRHWSVEIPVPVPAHMEFDLLHPHVFYASAHNIHAATIGTVLEGPASLFRLEIFDGETKIVGSYTDPNFYRVTQHSVFLHGGRVLVAVTCVPNRLVILDGETMSLWRDVELFEAEPIQFSETGALSPENANTCYSLNPSADGRFIVLENASDFIVYDMNRDQVLDARSSRSIPSDYFGRGHTRTAGQ